MAKANDMLKRAELFNKLAQRGSYTEIDGRVYKVYNLGGGNYRVERLVGIGALDFGQDKIHSSSGDAFTVEQLKKDMYKFPKNVV